MDAIDNQEGLGEAVQYAIQSLFSFLGSIEFVLFMFITAIFIVFLMRKVFRTFHVPLPKEEYVSDLYLDELYDPTGKFKLVDYPKTLLRYDPPAWGYEHDPIKVKIVDDLLVVVDGIHRIAQAYRNHEKTINGIICH